MPETQSKTQAENAAFILTRVFDAPRDLVFKAWTEPERLAQWWGPKGFKISVRTLDLRPDGIFHYCMQTPDGKDMWGKFVYREIASPERLVYTSSFSDAESNTTGNPWMPEWPLEVLNTLVFTEKDGKTTLKMTGIPFNATEAEINAFKGMHPSMEQGFGGTFAQLDEYLAKA